MQPAFCQLHRFGRDAARLQHVGVGVADQRLPGLAGGIAGGVAGQAQHVIGITRRPLDQPGADDAETSLIQTKDLRDMGQERILAGVIAAIGDRDLKQGFQNIDQHMVVIGADRMAIGIEKPRDLAGIGVKPRHILPCQVEDMGGMFLFAFGEGEDAAKGGDFVAGHGAIGLGHLGPKGKDGDGKADRLLGWRHAAQFVEDHRQRLAFGKGGKGFGDAGPDRHGQTIPVPWAGCQRNFCISTRSMNRPNLNPASGTTARTRYPIRS